jgi:hypothetical protein
MLSEVYPNQTWPELDLDLDATADQDAPRVRVTGGLMNTVGTLRWESDFGADDKPRRITEYRSVEASARLLETGSEVTRQVRGIRDGAMLQALIQRQAAMLGRFFVDPPPTITANVGLNWLASTVTSGVLLTCDWIPNRWTGTRGLVQQPAAVVGRGLNWDAGDVELELLLLADLNTALVAPCAQVTGWDAGTLVATCEATDVCEAGAATGVPATAVEGFAVWDKVMVVDQYFAPKSTDTDVYISAVKKGDVANTLELNKAPSSGPAAGDYLVFLHWASGAIPAAAWTDRMKMFARQADATTGALPDGASPVVYGGG